MVCNIYGGNPTINQTSTAEFHAKWGMAKMIKRYNEAESIHHLHYLRFGCWKIDTHNNNLCIRNNEADDVKYIVEENYEGFIYQLGLQSLWISADEDNDLSKR